MQYLAFCYQGGDSPSLDGISRWRLSRLNSCSLEGDNIQPQAVSAQRHADFPCPCSSRRHVAMKGCTPQFYGAEDTDKLKGRFQLHSNPSSTRKGVEWVHVPSQSIIEKNSMALCRPMACGKQTGLCAGKKGYLNDPPRVISVIL